MFVEQSFDDVGETNTVLVDKIMFYQIKSFQKNIISWLQLDCIELYLCEYVPFQVIKQNTEYTARDGSGLVTLGFSKLILADWQNRRLPN